MSIINCDTKKLADLATEFDGLVSTYKTNVNNIFDIIAKLPENAWFGKDGQYYVQIRMKNKIDFENHIKELNSFTQKISDASLELNNTIQQVKR